MEELLERAEEDVGEAAEYQHKLSLYAAMHPELDYDTQKGTEYPVNSGEETIRAEAGLTLYQKLVHEALVSASRKLEAFENAATDGGTRAEGVDESHWEKRGMIKSSYDKIIEELGVINRETNEELGIDIFEKTDTLEPVGTTPLNNLAD